MKKLLYFSLAFLLINSISALACTSLIISSRVTADGRPLMMKNRDTGELNNRLEYFKGPKYTFIGVVNYNMTEGEVWMGTNSVGFSIMNTASYNIKNDKVPDKQMDKEGVMMYKALGVCKTVDEFEQFLKDYPKPMGVEANFGIIDAFGGAAYFEVNNSEWVKYDVNDPAVAPDGYRVVTNFSESGVREKYQGWERYVTTSVVMKELWSRCEGKFSLNHSDLINNISRNYRNTILGVDFNNNPPVSGIAVDQDFVARKSTASIVVFEGVKAGENPLHTIMWTVLGYPSTSVAIPALVGNEDILPSYTKKSSENNHCEICDLSLKTKTDKIFTFKISNGSKYLNIANALKYGDKCKIVEKQINDSFYPLFNQWVEGKINDKTFYKKYSAQNRSYYDSYLVLFAEND